MTMPYRQTKALGNGWRVVCAGASDGVLKAVGKTLCAPGKPRDWTSLGRSRKAGVWKFSQGERQYVFKEYMGRTFFEPVKAFIKGTRAERAWTAGHTLLENGFLTPPMVAFGVKRRFGIPTRNFLVTEFVPRVSGFSILLKEEKHIADKELLRLKRNMIRKLGSTIGRLHMKGIIHGDLRPNNILVQDWKKVEPKFYFIDNERNSIHKNAPLKLIKKNLVQLNMIKLDSLSIFDRMRFFKAYIDAFPEMRDFRKPLAKEVWKTTEKRMNKYGGL